LPEKQRQHFLLLEHERLGLGSKRYVARIFGCHRQTIKKNLIELAAENYQADYTRQRMADEERKKKEAIVKELTN
jgi:DNA invertase Pin-like site-specific DNA recombinase